MVDTCSWNKVPTIFFECMAEMFVFSLLYVLNMSCVVKNSICFFCV